MYYRKNKKNKKIIIFIVVIAIFICLFFSLKLDRKTGFIENTLKDVSGIVMKCIMYPFTFLNEEKNVDQTESYKIQKNVNASLEKEIQELKDVLELKETLTEYSTENAMILSRNRSYWFQTLTIDKGKKNGIEKDMAVVTKAGLIGKISKVTNHTSEVKLITSDDVNYKVSVSIMTDNGDSVAILNGYDKDSGCVKIVGVDKESGIEKGDIVQTSGLGGKFPRGIYIGTIEKEEIDKYDVSKTLYVKTTQDFNNIHYVTVLKDKVE